MKVTNNCLKVDKSGYNRSEERKHKGLEGQDYTWLDGEIATPWGFVCVYAQGDDKRYHFTRLDFIYDGKMYVRSFRGKRYTKSGAKTKAMRFAKEIVDNNPKGT